MSNGKTNFNRFAGFFFTGLICLYTFSHNANLLLSGTNPKFRILGLIAAGAGELFLLYTLWVYQNSGGGQRTSALSAHAAMLVVLIVNVIVDYVMVGKKITAENSYLLEVYATYAAPVIIVVVLAIGLHAVLTTDPGIREHDARLHEEATRREIELKALETTRVEMLNVMDSQDVRDILREAAKNKVLNTAYEVSRKN